MPDLKDFEQFKKVLTNLSGEPVWRAARGEAITDSHLDSLMQGKKSASQIDAETEVQETETTQPKSTDTFTAPSAHEDAGIFDLPSDLGASSDGDTSFDLPTDLNLPDFGSDLDMSSSSDNNDFPSNIDVPGLAEDSSFGAPASSTETGVNDTPSFDSFGPPNVDVPDLDIPATSSSASQAPTSSVVDEDLEDLELPDVDALVNSNRSDDFSFEKSSNDDDYYAELDEPTGIDTTSMTMQELTAAVRGEAPLADANGGGAGENLALPKTSSTFDLSDFGDALEQVSGKSNKSVTAAPVGEDDDKDLFFRKYDLDRMEHTLGRLPRNLKVAVEEILASPETPLSAVRELTDKLMNGASARSIADDVRSISGRTIIVPLFYQKGTGEILEKRKRGFVYIFVTQAWPVLKKVYLTMLITATSLLAAFHLIYRPAMADYYYNSGYKMLLKGDYDVAEQRFNTAFHGWKLGFINVRGVRKQKWFYKYADAYSQQREFVRAVQKYEDLLQNYPNSKKTYMAYAHFEGSVHARYAEADRIYSRYLTNIDPSDTEVLLAAGDNLFEWGAIEPDKTELARQVYADLQYKLGKLTPTLGIRFLRYAIRVDNRPEIERWSRYFLTYMPKKRGFQVEPVTFSELAGWYLDNEQPGVAREILDMAMQKAPKNPYVLYQMARYYSDGGLSRIQEEQMLQRTYYSLMQYRSLTWQQTDMLVDVYRRLGLLYMQEGKDTESEENFNKSVTTYEEAVRGKVLVPREKYGKIYKEFGDLYYERKFDYDSALIYMNKALKNFYDTSELRYKLGYIYFLKKDYKDALDNFYLSFENAQDNVHVLFSYATTLAERGSYSAAEGIYDQLRIFLELRNNADAAADQAMTPEQKHRIVDLLAKTYNNLGVVRYEISRSSRESSRYRTLAETNLGQAVVLWDQLTRDSETQVRVKERGLPQTNFRAITYPSAGLQLALFSELPRQFPFGETQQQILTQD